jgi:hypothetical protein
VPVHDVSAWVRGPAVKNAHDAYALHWNRDAAAEQIGTINVPIRSPARPTLRPSLSLQLLRTIDGGTFAAMPDGEILMRHALSDTALGRSQYLLKGHLMGKRMLIRTPEDWQQFRSAFRNSVILDPTIVRVAELFLSGAKSAGGHQHITWALIRKNVGALAAFIDAIILYPAIPLIGYEASYTGIPPEMYAEIENLPLPTGLASCTDVLTPVSIFFEMNYAF